METNSETHFLLLGFYLSSTKDGTVLVSTKMTISVVDYVSLGGQKNYGLYAVYKGFVSKL